jgi:hypothetical protein
MFRVGIQPPLPRLQLAWIEGAFLHVEQPVHSLFGHLCGKSAYFAHNAK